MGNTENLNTIIKNLIRNKEILMEYTAARYDSTQIEYYLLITEDAINRISAINKQVKELNILLALELE